VVTNSLDCMIITPLLFPITCAPDKLGHIDRSWLRCRGKWPARGGTEV